MKNDHFTRDDNLALCKVLHCVMGNNKHSHEFLHGDVIPHMYGTPGYENLTTEESKNKLEDLMAKCRKYMGKYST